MLTVNNQAEVSTSYSKFVGLANLKIVTVNPTKAEIKGLFDREMEKEPEYWDKNTQQRKLVFYYVGSELAILPDGSTQQKDINGTHTVFMKDEGEVTKAGDKMVYIDKFGNSMYLAKSDIGSDKYKLDWSSLRVAFKGEADLIYLLKALAAPSREQEFYLPEVKDIILNGNVSVLRNVINQCNAHGNTIRALLGIRTSGEGKKYQTIYDRCIERGTNYSLDYFWKSLKKDQAYLKNFFGNFDFSKDHPNPEWFKLREYFPAMEGQVASSAAVASPQNFAAMFNPQAGASQVPGSSNITGAGAPIPSAPAPVNTMVSGPYEDDDDLPF